MKSNNGKPKVLLVEDAKIAQEMAQLILNQLHCEVDVADTGAEAIRLIHKNQYDLILMDLGLPDTDGVAIAEVIRKIQKVHIPIIALTSHINEVYKRRCLRAGMDDFIAKPLTFENGKEVLSKFFKK